MWVCHVNPIVSRLAGSLAVGQVNPRYSFMGQKLQDAMTFMVEKHRGTDRDGENAVPYSCHPVEVMLFLRFEVGATDEDHLCAALLHDTVEDTDATLKEIEAKFGPRVRDLVSEVTRDEPTAEQTAGMDPDEIWELRSKMLLEEIAGMSLQAKQIKLCDRLSNIRESNRTRSGKKLKRYAKQTKWILEAIDRKVGPKVWDAIKAEI